MELSTIIPHLEALVFASEKPLSTLELTDLLNTALGFIDDRASLDQVESALDAIREKYESEFYPFEVKQSGGGWQFLTKPVYHKTVAQLNGEKFLKRLSSAALETLSIIAYKQPVTKGEIENIRGVNCDYAVQKLLEKELIIITGRKENAPGQPLVYATSKTFMDYFGINSTDDLPKLKDVVSSETVDATVIGESNPADEDLPESDDNTFVVTETGEIEIIKAAGETNGEAGDETAGDEAETASFDPSVDPEEGMTETELEEAATILEEASEIFGEEDTESLDETVGTMDTAADNYDGLTGEEADQLMEEFEEGPTEVEEGPDNNEIEYNAADDQDADGGTEADKQKPDETAGGSQ